MKNDRLLILAKGALLTFSFFLLSLSPLGAEAPMSYYGEQGEKVYVEAREDTIVLRSASRKSQAEEGAEECHPSVTNNCCAEATTHFPSVSCATADYEAIQEINPDFEPTPYCIRCDIFMGAQSQHALCSCSETPVQRPEAYEDGIYFPHR